MTSEQAAKRARNAVKKAIALLRHAHEHPDERLIGVFDPRWLIGYEAETLLRTILWEGEMLVALLNEDADFDSLRRFAKEMSDSLRKQELLPKLENTTGRTPAEADAFKRKAEELRSG